MVRVKVISILLRFFSINMFWKGSLETRYEQDSLAN